MFCTPTTLLLLLLLHTVAQVCPLGVVNAAGLGLDGATFSMLTSPPLDIAICDRAWFQTVQLRQSRVEGLRCGIRSHQVLKILHLQIHDADWPGCSDELKRKGTYHHNYA
jgi:hypothetical protein